MGGEGFNGAPSANDPAKNLILVHTVQLKPIIKANSSGRTVSRGISELVIASVYSEKTCLKKLIVMKMIIIIIIMIKSQETSVFRGRQKLTKVRKVMVDFKFDALYLGKSS